MRVGLLFGSFNPVHNGHFAIAKECIKRGYVDFVRFVVANQNPFKDLYEINFWKRADLIQDAIHDDEQLVVSHTERLLSDLNKSTKTYDVINHFKKRDIEIEPIVICGDDVYNNIKTWYRGEDLLAENKFIVFTRDSKTIQNNDNIIAYINIDGFENYSSSDIRNKVKNGDDISGLVPDNIKNKIIDLYGRK